MFQVHAGAAWRTRRRSPPIDGNADDASASDGADNADDETADEPVTDEEALSKSEDSTDADTAVPVDFLSADADDGETAIIADDDKTTAIADAADVETVGAAATCGLDSTASAYACCQKSCAMR